MAQRKQSQLGTVRLQVPSLDSLSGLRIQRCRALWCRSQTWLGYGIAVALVQAGSNSSDWTPSLGTFMCLRCGPKRTKEKKKKAKIYQKSLQLGIGTTQKLNVPHYLKPSEGLEGRINLLKFIQTASVVASSLVCKAVNQVITKILKKL